MKDVVLIAAALAFVALGFSAMGRLDAVLFRNRIALEQRPCRQERALRIAFSNPLVAGAVTTSLERLCALHANLEVCLYAGDAQTICTQLAVREIDVAFLPDPAALEGSELWNQICVSLPQEALRGGGCNLPMLPMEDGETVQWVAWRKTACAGRVGEWMALLEKDLPSPGGSDGGEML